MLRSSSPTNDSQRGQDLQLEAPSTTTPARRHGRLLRGYGTQGLAVGVGDATHHPQETTPPQDLTRVAPDGCVELQEARHLLVLLIALALRTLSTVGTLDAHLDLRLGRLLLLRLLRLLEHL